MACLPEDGGGMISGYVLDVFSRAGQFAALGFVLLMATVLPSLLTVERAFNRV